jgi:hypothetical protein
MISVCACVSNSQQLGSVGSSPVALFAGSAYPRQRCIGLDTGTRHSAQSSSGQHMSRDVQCASLVMSQHACLPSSRNLLRQVASS